MTTTPPADALTNPTGPPPLPQAVLDVLLPHRDKLLADLRNAVHEADRAREDSLRHEVTAAKIRGRLADFAVVMGPVTE